MCEACRNRRRDYQERKRTRAKAEGLCAQCRLRPRGPGYRYRSGQSTSLCDPCAKGRRLPERVVARAIRSAKQRAKARGVPYALDAQWVAERFAGGLCEQTGIPFSYEAGSPWLPSLERKDPGQGYTPGNTEVVVWLYNQAKGSYTRNDLVRLAEGLLRGVGL